MGIRFSVGGIAIQGLLVASLLASAYGTANAKSAVMAPAMSKVTATLKGVVSVTELTASQANLQALQSQQNAPPVEQPVHRLPNGRLTSAPSQATINALPTLEPTATVLSLKKTPLFASINGFTGIYTGNNVTANQSEVEPPDQGLAVNNNIAAEINNNVTRFFDATTGAALTGPIANSAFFLASGFNLTDTQVFFDPTTNRWFFDEVMSTGTTMDFALAVSQTSNPLGQYWIYHIRAFSDDISGCGGQDCFPDYPKAGYDAAGFYITADLFNNVNFVESAIYAFPKLQLEAGDNFTYYRFDDPSDFVVQPSVPAPGEPFSTARNGSEFLMSAPGSPNLAVLAIYNTNNIVSNGSSMRLLRVTVGSQLYGSGTVPSTQPNVVGPYCQSVGVTSAPFLDGGYSAFQATVQKANDNLYGVLAFGSKDGTGLDRDVLGWFEVHPTLTASSLSASIVNQGYVVPTDGYSISYPAFGLNKDGAGALGMTITNQSASVPGGYPSASVIQFTGSAPTGDIFVTGPGFTSDDGFTGCPEKGPGKVGRWGDYGAATVDAATGVFYTANEMIPDPTTFTRGTFTNWGTFITQLY